MILLKMGTYGFLRFAMPFFPAFALSRQVAAVFVALAVIGIIYGALVAMVQPDLKKLVAYSSVSHLGFVMLGIWGGTVAERAGRADGDDRHGISTGALFFLIGMLYERRHTRLIADYGGLARVVPMLAAAFVITAFASIGLPGLNGFVGRVPGAARQLRALPGGGRHRHDGGDLRGGVPAWAVQRVFFNPLTSPENERLTDLTPRELAVLIPLIAGDGVAGPLSRSRSCAGWRPPRSGMSRPSGRTSRPRTVATVTASVAEARLMPIDLADPARRDARAAAGRVPERLVPGRAAGGGWRHEQRGRQPARGLALASWA